MEKIKIKYFRGTPVLKKFKIGDWIDLYCAEEFAAEPGDYGIIPLGVAMQLPNGYEAIIAPRSSLFGRYGIIMTNGIGVIANCYCGNKDEWGLPFYSTRWCHIERFTRIAQFRIVKSQPEIEFETVDFLTGAKRGGFRSTGK